MLAKAAREQMMHLEALQSSLSGNTAPTENTEEDQGALSGRGDEGANANKKRRRRAGKKQ